MLGAGVGPCRAGIQRISGFRVDGMHAGVDSGGGWGEIGGLRVRAISAEELDVWQRVWGFGILGSG